MRLNWLIEVEGRDWEGHTATKKIFGEYKKKIINEKIYT